MLHTSRHELRTCEARNCTENSEQNTVVKVEKVITHECGQSTIIITVRDALIVPPLICSVDRITGKGLEVVFTLLYYTVPTKEII